MTWPIRTAQMWSLGHFRDPVPPQIHFEIELWGFKFQQWLNERLTHFSEFEIRHPDHHWSVKTKHRDPESFIDSEVDKWHEDGLQIGTVYLGMWSNTISTEVRQRKGRSVYQAEPCEFVLFDNDHFVHREPSINVVDADTRWLVRINAGGEVKQHRTVRECTL